MGTIVIDVGQLYAERRQLQNGADAAVLSVAQDCPTTGCSTDTSTGGQAGTKANQNANDGAATVTEICGIDATPLTPVTLTPLLPCLQNSGLGPWDCRPPPGGALSTNYIQMRTETRLSGGGSLLPPTLARVLDPSYNGTNVRACARASWGSPSGLRSGLPLTISLCEFNFYGGVAGLATGPPFDPSFERVLRFHSQDQESGCPSSTSGLDAPGGFGWLNTADTSCETSTSTDDPSIPADPGLSAPSACTPAYLNSLLNTVVYVPVFGTTNGLSGNNIRYNIDGYAAFYLTGYKFSGDPAQTRNSPTLSPSRRCTGPERCIYGYFTQALTATAGTVGSGPSMGVEVVQLSG